MIKVTTIYTKENFLEFQKFHFLKKSKARIVFNVFEILLVILGVFGIVKEDYILGITELTLGIVLLIEFNTSIIPILQAKYILKSDSMLLGLENTFLFYEDHIEAINKRSTSNIPYEEIYMYAETNDYFYIYLNRVSAFLIRKEDIEEGKGEELKKLLKRKITNSQKK